MSTLTERMAQLPPAHRKRAEERARALIAEEMSLRHLRRARKQTQLRVAEKLRINQENVSRPEQRSDLLLSTLSGYVAAMGGKAESRGGVPRPPASGADRPCSRWTTHRHRPAPGLTASHKDDVLRHQPCRFGQALGDLGPVTAPRSRSTSTDESDTTTRRHTRHPAAAAEGTTPRM